MVTSDGYILGLYRIPGKLGEAKDPKKPPIVLFHSLVVDMMIWVLHKPDVAPAFVLARAGYDVWLANNRGNTYSTKHVSLDVKSREFWQFDWEDMGTKDVPACVDFIKSKTGHEKVNYMGHS